MKKIQCILQGVILLFSLCSPVWGADGRGLIDRNHSGESNSPFQAVVARDGSGDYRTVQEAVNAAPENSKTPWCIFVKNGSYREYLFIPKTKTFIHLIGQDKDKTIIHHSLNVGGKPEATSTDIDYWRYSVHNPESDVYKYDGSVVKIEASDFYSENISYVNDWGVDSQKGPQALAMSSQADRIAFNNCNFRSFQDTWMTTGNDTARHYVKDCWIEGAVDYFYGGGNVLAENCTFYNSMDAKKELPKVFRFDNAASTPPSPKSATMRNLIFSGPNKGKKMNSGNGAYDILNFSDNCYITSDLQEGNNRFEEITRIKQSSDDLFVDPLNGDFHIKPGAGFAGTGNAGDPRWY